MRWSPFIYMVHFEFEFTFNEPRNIAVYLLRQIRGENLNNIGEMFNIKAYSTVSGIIRRISRVIKYNRKIKKQIGKIQDSINMGL